MYSTHVPPSRSRSARMRSTGLSAVASVSATTPTKFGYAPWATVSRVVAFRTNGYMASAKTLSSGVIISNAAAPCAQYSISASTTAAWALESMLSASYLACAKVVASASCPGPSAPGDIAASSAANPEGNISQASAATATTAASAGNPRPSAPTLPVSLISCTS